jgi:DNA-directed RNA polymerase subunit RPC12/RpoP
MQIVDRKRANYSQFIIHRIHAGDNEINCKYCHSEELNGNLPLNVCMNCHKNIAEVAEYCYPQNTAKRFTMSKFKISIL